MGIWTDSRVMTEHYHEKFVPIAKCVQVCSLKKFHYLLYWLSHQVMPRLWHLLRLHLCHRPQPRHWPLPGS